MRILLLALGCFICMGNTNCSKYAVKIDTEMSALEAGDSTGLVEGCGYQPIPGYTYCRVREGEVAELSLYFISPPAQCIPKDAASCVHLEVFYPNGDPDLSLDFPRGVTRMKIQWKDLVKRKTFEKGDRGFWPFRYTIRFVDLEGREQITITEGEIRLRVVDKGYIPLHQMREDTNFVWEWSDEGRTIKMTTGGRTYVEARATTPILSPIPSNQVSE